PPRAGPAAAFFSQALPLPLQGPAMQVDSQALPDVAEQLVGGEPRGLVQTGLDEGQHLVGTLAGGPGAALAGEQARQAPRLKRPGQRVQRLAADAEGARDRARRLPVDPEAADHLVTDLDQVAGVEERAAAEEGVLNALGMGVQGTALGEEVRLGVEAVGVFHGRASLRPSNELCPGPASARRVPGGYDAQPLEERQSA